MSMRWRGGAVTCALVLAASGTTGIARAAERPVTPAGWAIDPAGTEIGVSKLDTGFQGPLGSALSPDGNHLLAVSSGAARIESTDLFDLRNHTRQDSVAYDGQQGQAVFYGVVYSPDGRHAWAAGGGQNVVHAYDVTTTGLKETGQIATPYFSAGLAYGRTPKGDRIYVANNLSSNASNAAGNPPGHQLTVIDPSANQVTGTIELGAAYAPLGVTFARDGRNAYVTNWLGRSVSVIDSTSERKVADIQLSSPQDPLQADHPSAITANPRRDEIYTANANSDTVSVIDTKTNQLLDTIDVSLVPGSGKKGAIPDGIDVSPDGKTLYVAEAGENAVAVVDLDSRAVRGFIPTSWYPADVKATPDGKQLVVTNTNDSGAGPNPCEPLTPRTDCPPPDPDRDPPNRIDNQYSGSMIKGSVSLIDLPRDGQLRALTMRVKRNNQVLARVRPKPKALRKIKHVIYVVRENRTYDQELGSLGKGNGDRSLNLFGDDSAPNSRALSREFATFDNFYADAEVSPDGHNWITGANATDYVDKTWPVSYSPSPRGNQRAYDFEDVPLAQQFAAEPLAGDPSVPRSGSAQTVGYLWDNAFNHGVSYRDYGEYVSAGKCGAGGYVSNTTHLQARFGDHVNGESPGYDLSCSDHTVREPAWERDYLAREKAGNTPALSIVRLPNDHTAGTRAGSATPQSYVADNDVALGRLVQVVSQSKEWKSTLILVTEDDAQNGPDHVDAHRTVALAISPYTRAGKVDSTHYDTASMVATVEDAVGLPPMGIVDQRATRMWHAFSGDADYRAYKPRKPTVVPYGEPGAPINGANAPMASAAAGWNLKVEDKAPEIALNQSIWKSIRGRDARMPSPRHVHIIGSTPTDQDG
jgi:YVTN family beta-propeller protein